MVNTARLVWRAFDGECCSKRGPDVMFTRVFVSSISVLPHPAFSPFGKLYQGQADAEEEKHEERHHYGETWTLVLECLAGWPVACAWQGGRPKEMPRVG